jgi:AraC-like DNA-binding protein
VPSVVTTLVDAPSLTLGRFRCPPSQPEWRVENSIGPLAHVVFPERPVTITRPTTGPQLGDRNWAVLYEPGQRYQRGLVDPAGDECTFVELTPALYEELVRCAASPAGNAFTAGRVLVPDRTWLGYQECLALAESGAEDRVVEQRLRAVLAETLRAPVAAPTGGDPRVHDACRLLATRLDERLTLSLVAGSVGLSTYHFCRLFRAATGITVHAYRQRLRLRQAFSSCASTPEQRLSEIAMSTGYASHSHMTTDFRQWLRMSPSTVRDKYARGSAAAGVGEQPFYLR